MSIDTVYSRIAGFLPEAIALRHDLHDHPEIALNERETRKRLRSFLGDEFRYLEPLLETDLIAEWPGRDESECIALRADMDALPTDDERFQYGAMHACGHDGHMAILAAAARLLADNRIVPQRTIRFVFQPGEEVVGAGRELAALGAYRGARSVYALHGWPGLPLGSVALKEGAYFGASHHFRALFRGRGGHGAYPEKGLNPLPPAARALLMLQKLHDEVFESHGEVVGACALNGGSASNVIPDEARLLGTVRYLEPERGESLETSIRDIFANSVKDTSIELELDYEKTYDLPVINNPSRCDIVRRAAKGGGQGSDMSRIAVIEEDSVERGSEDFAFALAKVPGCLFKLGLGEGMPPLHSTGFDFPDEALAPGILMMICLALGEGEK